MAAFHVPPFVFFVRCGGEAVFFVCSEDYPEVIYQNVNLLIPTLCGSIIRVFVRAGGKYAILAPFRASGMYALCLFFPIL